MGDNNNENNRKKTNSHFLNLFSLAIADSEVSAEELELLYSIGIENGVSKEDVDYLIDNPHKVKYVKPDTIEDTIEQLFDFGRMILADQKVDVREIAVFKSIATHLNISEERSETILEILIEGLKINEGRDSLISKIRKAISNI